MTGGREQKGREEKGEVMEGEGKNDLTHPLRQIPGDATVIHLYYPASFAHILAQFVSLTSQQLQLPAT